MSESGEQLKLKKYLLHELSDEERAAIEERFFADEEYFESLSMVEENLFQDYADGNLEPDERAKFEQYFLFSEDNRRRVKFARALRAYVREETAAPEVEKKPSVFDQLKAFFSLRAAAAVVVIFAIVGATAYFVVKRSSTDPASLVALNKAYQNERPTEARITGLDYAPVRNTRGAGDKIDQTALELARYTALKAANENPNAENLHALGRVYLAEKQFAKAIEQFEKAVRLAPGNARLRNDFGAALMEYAKTLDEGRLENLAKANEELAAAIKLDKSLTDAYFNRALCLQLLNLPNQAKEAWQKYLELDATSNWADEARKNLNALNSSETSELTSDDLEKQFLAATGTDDEAFRLITESRELIREKYLPQRLVMSYTQDDEKKKKFYAL